MLVGSDDQGAVLLPDLVNEIEMKLEDNSDSTRTQIDLQPNSIRIETPLAQSIYENSFNQLLCVENSSATTSREAPIFDVYPDPDESSHDSLDFITSALVKFQLKSY